MKKLLIIAILGTFAMSLSVVAKESKSLKKFNHKLLTNIEQILNDNPELIEKNEKEVLQRKPSSLDEHHKSSEALDNVEEQADIVDQW